MPTVQEVEKVEKVEAKAVSHPVAVTRSDSTTPIHYLSVQGMRLWSWPLGDNECVHTTIISLSSENNTMYAHVYGKGVMENVEVVLNCVLMGESSEKKVQYTIRTSISKVDTIVILKQELDIPKGHYAFSITSKSKIYVTSMCIETS